MPYVLVMATFELGNPMMLVVLVKTHDALIHGETQTRGALVMLLPERSLRSGGLGVQIRPQEI